jgi:hypothetical protein
VVTLDNNSDDEDGNDGLDDGEEDQDENINGYDMIVPETNVAVAAPKDSMDSMWFVKVAKIDCIELEDVIDSYKHKVPAGTSFMKGHFLERDNEHKHHTTFKITGKLTFFYKESVLFPYVQMVLKNNKYVLHNSDWLEIQYHVEQNGFAHL